MVIIHQVDEMSPKNDSESNTKTFNLQDHIPNRYQQENLKKNNEMQPYPLHISART